MTAATYSGVIVGTDGSDTAERAVGTAARIATALDVPLTIVTAWYRDMPDKPVLSELSQMPTGTAGAMEARWAEMAVSDGAAIARTLGVEDPRVETPHGHAADALLEEASRHPDSLLVSGTVGLGSATERLLGNIPHQLSHHATTDVLLVRTDPDRVEVYERVALATDGSKTAQVAVSRGLAFIRALGAEPTLLTIATDEQRGHNLLEKVADGIQDGGTIAREVGLGQDVAATLARVASAHDLLVIGNKGMSGPSRLLGSVANTVTHRVPTDILLVNTIGRR